MENLNRLIEIFSHFPGIGPRQARRFAYYLLSKPQPFINEFSRLINDIKEITSQCDSCQRLFITDTNIGLLTQSTSNNACDICGDKARDHTTLMIVARDSDFDSIERSCAYRGLYFILGGTVPILDKYPEKRIRLKTLLEKISIDRLLKEIILSLNTTPDGEHTTDIVREAITKLINGKPIKLTVLGRGLSTGAELEYVDSETIKNALKNRA